MAFRRRLAEEIRYVADRVEGRSSWMRACEAIEFADRIDQASELAEAALRRTDGRSRIWTDADYLCAVLALLMDGDRARDALLSRPGPRQILEQ